MINVSELIADPDFTQPNGISVKRTSYKIIEHEIVETTSDIKLVGIIVPYDSRSNKQSYGDVISEIINVYTYDPLYLTGKPSVDSEVEYLSDLVIFRNQPYSVVSVSHYEQYGFSKAVCEKLRQDVM